MPSFYRPGSRKGNRTWVVRGSVGGRQYEIATSATNKRAADDEWQRFRAAVEADAAAKRRADQPLTRETATVADAINLYLDATRPGARTEAALLAIKRDPLGRALLSDVGAEDLQDAAKRIKPGSPAAQNRWVIVPAAAALHLAARKKLAPYVMPAKVKEAAPLQPVAYPEDTADLADLTEDPELAALLLTLAVQGWRITETLMIERARIDWRRSKVERWVTKARCWQITEVDADVLMLWHDLSEHPDGRLFRFSDRWEVYRAVDRISPAGGSRWRPHMARRGFATAADEAGRSAKQIQAAGGWRSVASVLRYIQVSPTTARETIRAVRGRLRGSGGK